MKKLLLLMLVFIGISSAQVTGMPQLYTYFKLATDPPGTNSLRCCWLVLDSTQFSIMPMGKDKNGQTIYSMKVNIPPPPPPVAVPTNVPVVTQYLVKATDGLSWKLTLDAGYNTAFPIKVYNVIGALMVPGREYTYDPETQIITFTDGYGPSEGDVIQFEYWVQK